MREKLAEYAEAGAKWPLVANVLDPVITFLRKCMHYYTIVSAIKFHESTHNQLQEMAAFRYCCSC
jgi:hypothetical protein